MSSQLLTLSRAARLVGVTRTALQKKIREGEIITFEGKITVTDLLRVYPDVQLEDESMLEFVREVKAKAKPKRIVQDKPSLPSAEILASRLSNLSRELIETRTELFFFTRCLEEVVEKLNRLGAYQQREQMTAIQTLRNWLAEQMQQQVPKVDRKAQLLVKDTFLRLIAALVKVIPSGHEFFVEGTDSILESSLRAGLTLNYGCAGGNCGVCKARLISGEILKTRHHDYILSDAEKQMGYFLLCSNTAVTDIVVEAAEAHHDTDIPMQHIIAEVKKIERLHENFLVLHLQTPQTKTLRFISGQTVSLTVQDVSARHAVASCPRDGRHLQFHIRKKAGERFSELVFSELQVNHTVQIVGPEGEFILNDRFSDQPIIFIADDDGFAPIKSLIEHIIALENVESFYLYRIGLQSNHFYLSNLCRSWSDVLENFQYNELIVEEIGLERTLEHLLQSHAEFRDSEIYAAGSERFVQAIENYFKKQNFNQKQYHLYRASQ